MEKSGNAIEIGKMSAVQAVQQDFGIPVLAIANLMDLLFFLEQTKDSALKAALPMVQKYRDQYGVNE
jgi:orotate phosphoribosyltransferase